MTWKLGSSSTARKAGSRRSFRCERSGLPTAIVEQIKEDEVERVSLGRPGTPKEIAAWIVDLANPTACWITDQVRAVDRGLSIA
jgi:hypothetical protein